MLTASAPPHVADAARELLELGAAAARAATPRDAQPPHPSIAPRWRSTVHVHFTSVGSSGSVWHTGPSEVWSDLALGRMRRTGYSNISLSRSHVYAINSSEIDVQDQGYDLKNGVCRISPSRKFKNPFGWLGAATFAGAPAPGLTRWNLTVAGVQHVSLVARGDTPLTFTSHVAKPDGRGWTVRQDFVDFLPAPDPFAAATFTVPYSCLLPPKRCTAPRTPTTHTVYLAHPPYNVSKYNVADQDVADARGDAVFVCGDVLSGDAAMQDYQLISRYEIEVDPRWGEYALCNGYGPASPGCFGRERLKVGREASYGVGPRGLQCAATSPAGWWYSLPQLGECAPGATVGGRTAAGASRGCTWRVTRRIKTVDIRCVFRDAGMAAACRADMAEPDADVPLYARSEVVLARALEVADATCADVPPPAAAGIAIRDAASPGSSAQQAQHRR